MSDKNDKPKLSALEKLLSNHSASIESLKKDATIEGGTITHSADAFYADLPEGLTRESLDKAAFHMRDKIAINAHIAGELGLPLLKDNKDLTEVVATMPLGEFGTTSITINREGPGFKAGDPGIKGANLIKTDLNAGFKKSGAVGQARDRIKEQAAELL